MKLVSTSSLESLAYGFVPPVSASNLVLWSFLGGTAEKSAKNYAPGGVGSSVVGAPTFSPYHATLLPGSNYIKTAASQSADETIIVVARPLTDSTAWLVSNYTGPTVSGTPATTRGAGLSFEAGSSADGQVAINFNQSIKDGSNADQYASALKDKATNISSFSMIVGRCANATGVRTVKDFTTDQSSTTTSAFPVNVGATKLYIGSAPTIAALYQNAVDIAFAAVFQRALSDAELAVFYAWAKTYYASRSITV